MNETVKCIALKLKKPSGQKVSQSNDGVDHMAPELEVPVKDTGEKTDFIEPTMSSPSSERSKYSVMDKVL
jgi:hypothetical protein